MSRWRMRTDVLWHRLRGHRVTEGGNVTVTSTAPDGSFGFIVPPALRCSCGVAWEGQLHPLLRDVAAHRELSGFKRVTRG